MANKDQPADPGGNPFTDGLPVEAPPSLEQLGTYQFLKPVAPRILEKLQPNLLERTYAPGDTLLRLGDYSDAAYYIADGVVEV